MNASQGDIPLFAVILAGGSGTRFWPLSRAQYPKQVLRLLGSESLLQATIERLLPLIPLEQMAIVTSAAQEDVIRLELYHSGWENMTVWLEPVGRNTAAAVGLAAVQLQERWPQAVMAVFPADHYIKDRDKLLAALGTGARWAQAGC
ncbi:MAG: mannose-1-phosphate guanylyltransferase, partial [Deltaproteobacteria bacterium]|nr:mannose-1-phosphate guanylyltransferase [Deltaproteobacteria bacterium]